MPVATVRIPIRGAPSAPSLVLYVNAICLPLGLQAGSLCPRSLAVRTLQVGQLVAVGGHGGELDRLVAALAAAHRHVAEVAHQRQRLAVRAHVRLVDAGVPLPRRLGEQALVDLLAAGAVRVHGHDVGDEEVELAGLERRLDVRLQLGLDRVDGRPVRRPRRRRVGARGGDGLEVKAAGCPEVAGAGEDQRALDGRPKVRRRRDDDGGVRRMGGAGGVATGPVSPAPWLALGRWRPASPNVENTNRLAITMTIRPTTDTSGAIGAPGPPRERRLSVSAGPVWRPRVIPAWEALGLAPP